MSVYLPFLVRTDRTKAVVNMRNSINTFSGNCRIEEPIGNSQRVRFYIYGPSAVVGRRLRLFVRGFLA
jgi:hypothetical protein